MGAPENFAQVADLLIEAALLPSQLNRGVAGGGVGKKNFFLSFFYFSMCASGECVRGAIVHECGRVYFACLLERICVLVLYKLS